MRIKEKIMFQELWQKFYNCFLDEGVWRFYLIGLRNTLLIAIGACVLGLLIGVIVTCIRVAPKTNVFSKILNGIAHVYVTVIRGTPVVLQLFICYFVLLAGIKSQSFFGLKYTNAIYVAIITFGINSGAYMSEILRGGINSVDYGQTEAGRSLGMTWLQTFFKIVLPQALKSAIPTMFNEFITLVKETSVAGYVGIIDLTKIKDTITVQSMDLYTPLFIIAAIYLLVVLGLQQLQRFIERRLRKSDKH